MKRHYYLVKILAQSDAPSDNMAHAINLAIDDLGHRAVLVSTYTNSVYPYYVHGIFKLTRGGKV